ncbi:MAG: hypothetical protein AAGC72_07740 [Planctomycetota bacterium]
MEYLSPRQLGRAIGVSESSLKRWIDAGKLPVSRTAGGHRRVALSDAILFLRQTGHPVQDPEALGLTAGQVLAGRADAEQMIEALAQLLEQSKEAAFISALVQLYIDGRSIAEIVDGPLRGAMERIGEIWRCRDDGIGIEHRASEICFRAVAQLRAAIPPPKGPTPCAIGGGPPGDPYILPSMCIATVLAAQGWHEANLGANVPWEQFVSMAGRYNAALAWVSVTGKPPNDLHDRVMELADKLAGLDVTLVVGGQALPGSVRRLSRPNLHTAATMAELSAFARGALTGARKFRPTHLNGSMNSAGIPEPPSD